MDTLTPIRLLAEHVRSATIALLQVDNPRWLTWAPAGTSNHMLWHAGHALWLQDLLSVQPLSGESQLPAGWEDMFGARCRPVETTTKWPDAGELRQHLTKQVEHFERLLREHAEVLKNSPERMSAASGWPLLPGIIHGWHDEARHQGEMYLLLKMVRAGSWI